MFFLREALRNLSRHRRVDLVAICVIAIGMCLVSGAALTYVNFRNFAAYWGGRVRIVIYLRDDLTPERLEALRVALSQAPETAALEYTSKDQALQQFRARLADNASILEGLQTNPLPASFTVTVRPEFRQPKLIHAMVERFRQLPEIEEIDYGEQWIERFHTLIWVLEVGMIAVGALTGVAMTFIIATTVRLALYARAEEIEIMHLVGATGWLINAPFVLEGVLQGILGTSLAIALVGAVFYVLVTWLRPMGELFVDFSLFQFLPPPVIASLLLGGGFLGGIGSMFSLRRSSSPT